MAFHLTFEQQKNMKALGITLGVHVLLLLFFLFFTYSMPLENHPEPLGLEVNLGTSLSGSGTNQPEAIGNPSSLVSHRAAASRASAPAQVSLHGLVTTKNENAPSVSVNDAKSQHKKGTSPQPRQGHQAAVAATKTTHKERHQKPKYFYPGSTGNGQGNGALENHTGDHEGIGTGNKDMGAPGGTPGASNYQGVPSGTGNIYALVGNRYLVEKPNPKAKYRAGGKVVLQVTVSRSGKITGYSVKSAANAVIRAIALEKIKHVRFNQAPDASVEEHGTITFDFVTH